MERIDLPDENSQNVQLLLPLPLFKMKISLDYLMDFYIHTGNSECTCELSLENPCACFSKWLENIYKIWYELGKIKKNVLEQEGKEVNPYKEFDLRDMVKVFNEIPNKKTLLTFLSEVSKYFVVRVVCHFEGTRAKQKFWYPDGQAVTFPHYKNIEKLNAKCPYT